MPESSIESGNAGESDQATSSHPHFRWGRFLLWSGAAAAVVLLLVGVTALVAWNHVQPFLRARVVNSLAARFRARVELDSFQASAAQGFAITGGGLRIVPFGLEQYPPVISVDSFSFHMTLDQLFSPKRHVRMVHVDGLRITLPPKRERQGFTLSGDGTQKPGGDKKIVEPKLYVDEIVATNAQLTLLTDNPQKLPLVFDIHKLRLTTKWDSGAMHYVAALRNAKPVGDITSEGDFGPWDATNPRATPITGDYTFNHADLSTTKGIAGMLNSTGHFQGPLDHLTVDGRADVPDFRIQESGHPVALFTTFHATVDGTNGDTYLQPVHAHFRNTWFDCTGSVVRVKQDGQGLGHHIALHVDMPRGRIEDLLWLAVKTSPPVVTGNVKLNNSFDLPPDPTHQVNFARRMLLKGSISVTQMHFSDAQVDKKVDSISLRTQGKAAEANQLNHTSGPDSVSLDGTLYGQFTLRDAVLNLDPATFTLPGVSATVHGNYSLDGQLFDFSGNARLQATVSQMFTGWKHVLLKPADRFFEKNGAGTYIQFHIGGTKEEPEVGVDLGKHRIEVKR
jgi:hypothetical protein